MSKISNEITNVIIDDKKEIKYNKSEMLLTTLLENLCYLVEMDTLKASLLYQELCLELKKIGFLENNYSNKDADVSRKLVRDFISKLFKNTQIKLISNDSEELFLSDSKNEILDKPNMESLIELISENRFEVNDMRNILMTTSRYANEFVKLEHMGEGSYGLIDKVYHKLDGKIYAIKKIPLSPKMDKDIFKSKLDEIRVLAKMNHSNILRYHSSWMEYYSWEECFEGDSSNSITELEGLYLTIFLQTEICDSNLREWLISRNKTKKLDINISLYILKQILDGLSYLHKMNLIHRDIKPENILLVQPKFNDAYKYLLTNGENITDSKYNFLIKIADFGLAKSQIIEERAIERYAIDEVKIKNTEGIGTRLYSSPEQLKTTDYNYKSDLYSLGLIIAELFTIIEVNDEDSFLRTLRRDKFLEDSIVKDIILSCLSDNSEDRLDCDEMIKLLFAK
jgi:serine/threonine protein kinase